MGATISTITFPTLIYTTLTLQQCQSSASRETGRWHTTWVRRPWPEEKRLSGGPVGKLPLLSRWGASSHSGSHDTAPPPSCCIYPHAVFGSCLELTFSTEPPSLFGEEPLWSYTKSGRRVWVHDRVSLFIIFFFLSFFLSEIIKSTLNFVMNSSEMTCHLSGCKLLYVEESKWGFDQFQIVLIFLV